MFDCAVVGSGVAGISAALTRKRNEKVSFCWDRRFKRQDRQGGVYPQLSRAFVRQRTSVRQALKEQLKEMDIPVTDERVTGVYALKDKFSLLTESGAAFESKTVILTTGVEAVKQIPGEAEFIGRGVSYCATCDGFLYKGKTIAVLCTSERFEREIEYLADLAKKVYLIPLYKNVAVRKENIEKIVRMPTGIAGGLRAQKLLFKEEELPVDGIFMLKESVSPAVLVGGLEMENGHVKVNRDMSTNLKGCFAAGTARGRPYQYAKAAGEGNVAAHAVCERKE